MSSDVTGRGSELLAALSAALVVAQPDVCWGSTAAVSDWQRSGAGLSALLWEAGTMYRSSLPYTFLPCWHLALEFKTVKAQYWCFRVCIGVSKLGLRK